MTHRHFVVLQHHDPETYRGVLEAHATQLTAEQHLHLVRTVRPRLFWVAMNGFRLPTLAAELSKVSPKSAWSIEIEDHAPIQLTSLNQGVAGKVIKTNDVWRALGTALGASKPVSLGYGTRAGETQARLYADSSWREIMAVLAPPSGRRVAAVEHDPSAVFAAPHERTVRDVYADALMEASDPRGEFIRLQSTQPRTPKIQKRLDTLLELYGTTWAKPFLRVMEWRFGFPSHVRVFEAKEAKTLVDYAGWSMVQAAEISPKPLAVLAKTQALRRLEMLSINSESIRTLNEAAIPLDVKLLAITGGRNADLKRLRKSIVPSLVEVHLGNERSPSQAHADFMRKWPGVLVTTRDSGPTEALSSDRLAKLRCATAADIEAVERSVENVLQAEAREQRLPTNDEVLEAISESAPATIIDLLDRAKRLDPSGSAFRLAVNWFLDAHPSGELLAHALRPFLREITLKPEQWAEVAKAGRRCGNAAMVEVASEQRQALTLPIGSR